MKKYIIIAALFLSALCANAQWKVEQSPADELKGTKASTHYLYNADDCVFVYTEPSAMIMLSAKNHIFDAERNGAYTGASITVGLYTSDDTLIEKIIMWLDNPSGEYRFLRTRNAGTMANPVGQKKKIKKIMEHLTTTDGYIRLLAPIFNAPDIDVKIPHIQQ